MVIESRQGERRSRVPGIPDVFHSVHFGTYRCSSTVEQRVRRSRRAAPPSGLPRSRARPVHSDRDRELYAFPKRSDALIIQRDGDMIIATNAGFTRDQASILRDVLTEDVFVLSDEDRDRLKGLSRRDGYYPAMLVETSARSLLGSAPARCCSTTVFVVDNTTVANITDSSSQSREPSSHSGSMSACFAPGRE